MKLESSRHEIDRTYNPGYGQIILYGAALCAESGQFLPSASQFHVDRILRWEYSWIPDFIWPSINGCFLAQNPESLNEGLAQKKTCVDLTITFLPFNLTSQSYPPGNNVLGWVSKVRFLTAQCSCNACSACSVYPPPPFSMGLAMHPCNIWTVFRQCKGVKESSYWCGEVISQFRTIQHLF